MTLLHLFRLLLIFQKYDPAQTNEIYTSAFWLCWKGYLVYQIHLVCWRSGAPNALTVVPQFGQHFSKSPSGSVSRGWWWNSERVHGQLTCWKCIHNTYHKAAFYQRNCPILGIPNFTWGIGLSFIENLQAPTVPTGWGHANTSNQNWGVRPGGPYINVKVAWGSTVPAHLAYMPKNPVNLRAAARWWAPCPRWLLLL